MLSQEGYGEDYFDETHTNWFLHPHVWLFEQLRSRIAELGSTPKVLDVGCGRGDFLRWLSSAEPSWHLTGVDLAPNEPRAGIEFIQGDVLALPLEARFDAVVNLAVIEHVVDVHAFTKLLASQCREGGRVFIMTLNEGSTLYSTARVLRQVGRAAAFNRLYSAHHLNHFTISSLRRLVSLHGMEVIETLRHNIPMKSVDVPRASPLVTGVWKAGVWGTFRLGELLGRTYLQTIVCRPMGS